jgi:hypothetical protein
VSFLDVVALLVALAGDEMAFAGEEMASSFFFACPFSEPLASLSESFGMPMKITIQINIS